MNLSETIKDFTEWADLLPMHAGKAHKTLIRPIKINGEFHGSVAGAVAELLAAGYVPDQNKYRLISPNGSFFKLNKTAVNYAQFLYVRPIISQRIK